MIRCVFERRFLTDDVHKKRGCLTAQGVVHQHGSNWLIDDCTNCTCTDGQQECQAALCFHRCSNPIIVEGECCPVCDGMFYIF